MFYRHLAAALDCPHQGTGMGEGNMEDKLLPIQQVLPLRVADLIQEMRKIPCNVAPVPLEECHNKVKVSEEPP